VNFQHQGCVGVEGAFVVIEGCSVGRADLAQPRTAAGEQVGYAEPVTDLDELPATDDYVPTGGEGRGRALGLGELKLSGQVMPNVRKIVYNVDIKRVMRLKLVLGIADGWLSADDEIIYRAKDLRVGLLKQGAALQPGT